MRGASSVGVSHLLAAESERHRALSDLADRCSTAFYPTSTEDDVRASRAAACPARSDAHAERMAQ